MDLADASALVTGGSGAVGRAVVAELARAGADVAVAYHTDAGGAETAAERAREHGVAATTVAGDVTDDADAARLVEVAGEFDGDPLRAVVTCAGVTDPHALQDGDADRLRDVLEVNVVGTATVARAAVERMRDGNGEGDRAVVAVSSVAAETGTVDTSYAAAKGGVHGFVRALARECGSDGIRAAAVAPGPVDSPMNDEVIESLERRRFRGHRTVDTLLDRYEATPAEVAEAVRFLAGHEFVTGEVLRVDGGMSL